MSVADHTTLLTKVFDISYCLKKYGYLQCDLKAVHDDFNDTCSHTYGYFSEPEVGERRF